MQKLVQGIHEFQTHVFRTKRELFKRLAKGQTPAALMLTCSDSRVNPNLLTQTEPGDIFIVRNAGNIIPAAPAQGGEIATIEFAVKSLGIRDIIVCGHSDCGAMKGVLNPGMVAENMPALAAWLSHAQRTQTIIEKEYKHLEGRALLSATVAENVIVQIENLRTHDFIAQRLAAGSVRMHGWVYKFETGEVFAFDPKKGQFLPLVDKKKPISFYKNKKTPIKAHQFSGLVCSCLIEGGNCS